MQTYPLSLTNRLLVPTVFLRSRHYAAQLWAGLAKIPLQRWQFIVRFLLIIFLSFSLARLFWLLVPSPTLPSAVVAIPLVNNLDMDVSNFNGNVSNSNNSSINIAQLKSLNLFGKAGAVKQESAPAVELNAAETQLNLVLVGVITSNDDKLARAIIAAGNVQDIYAIGAALPIGNGIAVENVMLDRVIINNNGQIEALLLYQKNEKNNISSSAYTSPVARNTSSAAVLPSNAVMASSAVAPALPSRAESMRTWEATQAAAKAMDDENALGAQ